MLLASGAKGNAAMQLMRSLHLALSTYTRLPLPRADFKEEDMKYAMCFFPLAGVVIGLFFMGWGALSEAFGLGSLLRTAGFVLVPLLVTGGIHMDGFLDASDALASWQPRDKKLKIMKDPHMGAFAVIRAGMYLVAVLGVYSEIVDFCHTVLVAFGFVLSRCLAILLYNLLPNARGSGMMQHFQQTQGKAAVLAAAGMFALLVLAAETWLAPVNIPLGVAAQAITALWFYILAKKQFGGITGDLTGFFIQVSELAFSAAILILGRLL